MSDYISRVSAIHSKWEGKSNPSTTLTPKSFQRNAYTAHSPSVPSYNQGRWNGSLHRQTRAKQPNNGLAITATTLASFKRTPSRLTDLHYVYKRPITHRCCTCMPMSRDSFVVEDAGIPDMVNVLRLPARSCQHSYILRVFSNIVYTYRHTVRFGYPNITESVTRGHLSQLAIERTVQAELEKRGEPLDETSRSYRVFRSRCEKQLRKMFNRMKAVMSITIFKITGWFLNTVLGTLLNSIQVHDRQLRTLKEISLCGKPVIYLPLHKSHLDYVLMTYILWHYGVRAPYVAAGDNLNIPLFGGILRSLGGFFIRRRLDPVEGQRDHLYRALLKSYVAELLDAGQSLEFFIEGGRSRSGRALYPKAGLLSVVVDWVLNSKHETDGVYQKDVLVVPVSISYERIMDGNFTREQMGQPKVPESFRTTARAIWKLFSSMFGSVRVDFGQPFSLKEYITVNGADLTRIHPDSPVVSSPPTLATPPGLCNISGDPIAPWGTLPSGSLSGSPPTLSAVADGLLSRAESDSSIYGVELCRGESKPLVETLARHVIHSSIQNQAMMSSGVVIFALLNKHRQGVSFADLISSVSSLRDEILYMNHDVGFIGDIADVIIHVIRLHGAELISVHKISQYEGEHAEQIEISWRDLYSVVEMTERQNVVIRPNVSLPHVLELSYYANSISAVFIREAITVSAIAAVCEKPLIDASNLIEGAPVLADEEGGVFHDINAPTFSKSEVVERAVFLCQLLKYEFLITAPCGDIETDLMDGFERLITQQIVHSESNDDFYDEEAQQWSSRIARRTMYSLDEDELTYKREKLFQMNYSKEGNEALSIYCHLIQPTVECYWQVACQLLQLLPHDLPVKDFTTDTHQVLQQRITNNITDFPETVALDSVRNAIKVFTDLKVISTYTVSNEKMVGLMPPYNTTSQLNSLITAIENFKPL